MYLYIAFPGREERSEGHPWVLAAPPAGPAHGRGRFEQALADFARQAAALPDGLQSVAMPMNIGGGKAGRPGAYRAAIERFAARHPCRVVLYHYEPPKKKRRYGRRK